MQQTLLPAVAAAGASADAASIAVCDLILDTALQHDDVEQHGQWPEGLELVRQSQHLLSKCGEKGLAYLKLMSLEHFAGEARHHVRTMCT
jgi:hypothetical protein